MSNFSFSLQKYYLILQYQFHTKQKKRGFQLILTAQDGLFFICYHPKESTCIDYLEMYYYTKFIYRMVEMIVSERQN